MSFTEGARSLPEAVLRAAITAVQERHGSSLPAEVVEQDERELKELFTFLREDPPLPAPAERQKQRDRFLSLARKQKRPTDPRRKARPGGTTQTVPSSGK